MKMKVHANFKGDRKRLDAGIGHIRLLAGLGLALIITAVLMMGLNPVGNQDSKLALSQTFGREGTDSGIDSKALSARVLEQKFQIHMQESDQGMGEIPYVEVWVLNDPFYPLMGEAANLRASDGVLSSKEWQMLGFPNYEIPTPTSSSSSSSSTSTSTSSGVTTSTAAQSTQRVVMVQEIYEMRGIRYAIIKVNDSSYDKLKAGSDFADVLRVKEIKDNQTVVVLCGDEIYELKLGELRKI
jgi:hypothetical protein